MIALSTPPFPSQWVFVSGCSDCTIVIGAVGRILRLDRCDRVQVCMHGDAWGCVGVHGDAWGCMGVHGEGCTPNCVHGLPLVMYPPTCCTPDVHLLYT